MVSKTRKQTQNERSSFLERLVDKLTRMLNVEDLDEEAIRMVERMTVLRISTKHINLWSRQLEMKRQDVSELAGMMNLGDVSKEIRDEKDLERWARRCSNFFPKKAKRLLFEEIDNMVWCGGEKEIVKWCQQNKVYDEITEKEIEEIWMRESPDEDELIRLNGKYVWETAKRVCDFIDAHEDLIHITSFGEYKKVMKNVMAIREAGNVEQKRSQTSRKKDVTKQKQGRRRRRRWLLSSDTGR